MSRLDEAKSVGLPYVAERTTAASPADLEEFHERHAKDTWWYRVSLMTLIFGMLAVNLWMTSRSYTAMMIDVDTSRITASAIDDQTTARLDEITRRLERIEARLPPAPDKTGVVASAE